MNDHSSNLSLSNLFSNDEIPIFIEKVQETVLEGMPKGTKVTQVEAVDHDGTYPNSKVSIFVIILVSHFNHQPAVI